MKLTSYAISAFIFFIALKGLADNPHQVVISFPEQEKPKEEPAPPEGEPIKLPEDIRNQLHINVLNSSGHNLIFYTKIRAATGQEGGLGAQPWEYIKVNTLVKESATVATFHGGPQAKYEYERSRLYMHEKDEEGKDEFDQLECKLAPSTAGKTASKNITFVVGKEPGEDVVSCLVYYDK